MRSIGLISECLPEFSHADDRYDIAHRRVRPDCIEQFFFRDQLTGMFDEEAQHGEGFGPEGNGLRPPPETLTYRVKAKRAEGNVLPLLHFSLFLAE